MYHHLVGVEHFTIYDNDSDDDTRAVLAPLIAWGLVTLKPWPGPKRAAQEAMLDECFSASNAGFATRVAHFDVDEFVNVPSQTVWFSAGALRGADTFLLHELLDGCLQAGIGAVVVDRLDFGCNGHRKKPKGLVLNQYTDRLVPLAAEARKGKVFVHAPAIVAHRGAHEPPVLASPWTASFANRAPWSSEQSIPVHEPFRMHHFVTRSYEECVAKAHSARLKSLNSSWRVEVGEELCKRHLLGSDGYYRIEHMQDYSLAHSRFISVVAAILDKLEERRT